MKVEPGDRVEFDNGENIIITPQSESNPHNFGPVSARDSTVYTCQRPGGDTSGGEIETSEAVQNWKTFMQAPERDIKHVFILLSEEELTPYKEPGLIKAYEESRSLTVHHIPYASDQAFKKIMIELDEVHKQGEKAVIHCTHGMGRSGRVAAGWLLYKYGLPVDEAIDESLDAARKHGVQRMGTPGQLMQWIGNA